MDKYKNKLQAAQSEFETIPFTDVSHGILLNTDLNKAYCKCSNCGQVAEVDTSVCLTSNPPKYNYHCPHCDNYSYVLCSEVFYDTKIAQFEDIPFNVEGLGLAAPCLICEESVPVSILDNHSKICEKCKKAILKLRKMLEED